MITPDNLVSREVHYCVSYLVSTLAGADYDHGADDLGALMDQAMELRSPVLDYAEGAEQAGWIRYAAGQEVTPPEGEEPADGWWYNAADPSGDWYDAPEAAASNGEFDPYEWEVFEHWIVSDWLADKLAAKGEKVDKDFAGMVVWARTTSGQGIASDSVIGAICAELNAA